jgi:p-hydroxybenzoate 3-monooxygenase
MHLPPGDADFDHRRQIAELDYMTHSRAASMAFAENYTGLSLQM